MMRFYDVTRGSDCIDGVDVRELSLDGLRKRFGVVLQDAVLARMLGRPHLEAACIGLASWRMRHRHSPK